MRAWVVLLCVVWSWLVVSGCGEEGAPSEDGGSAEPSGSVADGGAEPTAVSRDGCPDWAEDLSYGETSGLVAADESGAIAARVIEASDVPARRGENTWRLRLEDADGEPLEGRIVRWACGVNPDHGHGFAPTLVQGRTVGEAELSDLRLWVEGGWEVRLWIDAVDSGKDPYVAVTPCAPTDEDSRAHDIAIRVCVPL